MSCQPVERKKVATHEWKWSEGKDPPFHVRTVHRAIEEYYDRLFKEGEKGRVFVPLCGKSVDMIHFANQGHEVVGIEFSEIGVEDFFKENNLTYEKTEGKPFVVYKAKEKNITIFRGDFFAVNKDLVGEFDVFWDRGSFVAINMDQRVVYTDLILPLMKKSSKYLLNGFTYDTMKYPGPPHYVTKESLEETFGRYCSIQYLGSFRYDAPEHMRQYIDELIQDDYLLMLKSSS